MKKITLLALATATALSACAQAPDQVVARSVSTTPYQNLSCNQLMVERNQIVTNVSNLTEAQKKKANSDAVAMGIGMVLFWPALFALSAGSDQSDALAEAKGRYEAVEATRTARGCTA